VQAEPAAEEEEEHHDDDDDDDASGPVQGTLSRAGAQVLLERVAGHVRASVAAAGVSPGLADRLDPLLRTALFDAHAELPARTRYAPLRDNGVGVIVAVADELSRP
jgi:hypothetical protein